MFAHDTAVLTTAPQSDDTTPVLSILASGGEASDRPRSEPRMIEASGRRAVFQPRAWRRFELYERGDEVNVFEGHDKSLDDAIRHVQNIFADALEHESDPSYHHPQSAGRVGRHFNDIAIWEADRILAVFRPLPDGTAEVTRFDR